MSKMRGPGKQLPDGTIITIEKAGGVNSMRCIRCKRGTASQMQKNGRLVYKCGACGAMFAATRMK